MNEKRYLIKFVLLSLVTILLLDGCKPKREIKEEISPLRLSPEMAVVSLHENQLRYNWFAARFTGSVLLNNNTNSISGSLRIEKDKAIYVSIAPVLGIELVRALVTPDSVKIVNRLDGTYYLGNIDILNQLANADIDFFMLQALLTGNDFPHFQKDHFNLFEEGDLLRLQNPGRKRLSGGGNSFNQSILIDPESMKIKSNVIIEEQHRRSLRADYKLHDKIQEQWVPSDVQILFTDGSGKANLNLLYNRITINEPQRMQFSVPARYKPMDLN